MENVRIATLEDLLKEHSVECGDQMVNISDILTNCVCEYQLPDMLPFVGKDLWARKMVARRLNRIGNAVKEYNPLYRLKIVYGYRHPYVQTYWYMKILEEVRTKNPTMSEAGLRELAHTMVAFPEVGGHPTGGAVDVTITTPEGDLDMGSAYADFSDPEVFKMFSEKITEEQKANRKLLHDFMVNEEFAPYYGEWWHYSYGDREWSWFYERDHAVFSPIYFSTT